MPSQQYEPPNRDASPGDATASRADEPGSTRAEDADGSMAPRAQPSLGATAGDETPGTQTQPAYGSYGAAPAYDSGPGSSRSDTSPGGGYGGYDPPGREDTGYDYSRSGDGAVDAPPDSAAVRAREKEAFGGVKFGAAFFGWLTAVGATVILVAIVAAVASALDLSTTVDGSSQDPSTLGVGKIIAGLAILFVAYYCGGYVAGRMARFNGARQGVAVWLWAVVIAAVLTLLGVLFGSNDDLARDVSLPDVRVDLDTVTAETLIAIGVVLGVTLLGAIVGGLTGMRFHRRVDRAGFTSDSY